MKVNKVFAVGIVLAFFVCGNNAYAQKGKNVKKNGYEVKFIMPGLPDSVLFVAYYYGAQTWMFDTLYVSRKEPYTFVMKGDSALPRGIYVLASESKVRYMDFLVDSSYFFTVKTGKLNPERIDITENIEFINSPENAMTIEFFKKRTVYYSALEAISKEMKGKEEISEEEKEKYRAKIGQYQDSMRIFRENFLKTHENTFFVKTQRFGEEITVPEPPKNPDGSLVDSAWSYQYYLNHYWDNCDFSEPALVRTPIFHSKISQYFENVIIPIPDTINKYSDLLVEKAKNTPDLLKYIIWFITNKYERSQYVGQDAVFVHMVKTYYEKGLCPWENEERLMAMAEKADQLDKILIGRKAPELIMPDTNGIFHSNYGFNKKYTIMFFWDVGCGHCKTATPILKEFYERAKDSLDFEVYAVCIAKDTVKWKQDLREKGVSWVNVGKNTANIDFPKVYGVKTTPIIFILDREKKIIVKNISAEEIEKVIRNHEEGKRIR